VPNRSRRPESEPATRRNAGSQRATPLVGIGITRVSIVESFLAAALFALTPGVSRSQQLEPRAYAPNPVGVNFAGLIYGRSEGDVVFNASLPLEDVEATVSSATLAYGRTFGLANRSASISIAVPYIRATVSGETGEARGEVHRSGLADTHLRFAVNLLGLPAMSLRELEQRRPRPTLGASVLVVAPTGQYDSARLINIGSNRWAFKPELGLSVPMNRWYFDLYAGVWLFTENSDYFRESEVSQDSMTSVQAHVSYTFRRNLWLAADATYYAGGRTHINDVPRPNRQENTRVGLTLSVPAGRGHSIRIAWSDGATVRVGGDFSSVSLAWQYTWF